MNWFKYVQITYLRQDSILASVDALSKFLLVVVISVAVYFFRNPIQTVWLFGALIFVAVVLGRVPIAVTLATFSLFVAFGSLVMFFQFIAHQSGPALVQLGFLKLTADGLRMGALFLLRLATIGSAALLFIWTTNPKHFVVGLTRLGVPYRLGFAVLVAMRFLPMIHEEVGKVRSAHLVRGGKPATGIRGRFENWRRYLFPVLVNALRKSETTSIAMDSRGFGLYTTRTYVEPFRWTWSGMLLLFLFLALIGVMGYQYGLGFVQPRYTG